MDYVCDQANRIAPVQTSSIVDLLEDLRREAGGKGIVEKDQSAAEPH